MRRRSLYLSTLLVLVLALLLVPGVGPRGSHEVAASQVTFYATSSDGQLVSFGSSNYLTAHNAAAGSIGNTMSDVYAGQLYYPFMGINYAIYRSALFFDTSSIPDGAIITSADLSLYGTHGPGTTSNYSIAVVRGADLNDPLVAGDYGDLLDETQSRGQLPAASWVVNGWNGIQLNSTGLAEISKTATTKLALRSTKDILAIAPSSFTTEYVSFSSAEGGNPARLTVTYQGVAAPTVTTNNASSVTQTSATLRGYLNNDGGEACLYRFQWGLTTSYGNATWWRGWKTSGQSFSESISGLSPDTTYHFRAQANNSAGTSSGGDRTFTTGTYQYSPPWWTYHTFYYDWAHNTTFLNDTVDDIIRDGDYYPWVEEDECVDYAKEWMPYDAVWAFCGHGNRTSVKFWDGENESHLYADDIADREWYPDGPFIIPDLADVRLMVFGGCNTAENPDDPGGLLYAAVVVRGVDSAVGFEETVTINGETWWCYAFFDELVNNQRTVESAALVARNRVIVEFDGSCGGTSSYLVRGNGSTKVIPPGYGTP